MKPSFFAGPGSTGTTLSFFAHPSRDNSQRHRAQYANVTSDLASAALTFYTSSPGVLVTANSASGQTTINAPGTGNFANADVVLIYQASTKTFTRGTVSSVTADTVVLSGNLTVNLVPGDAIFKRGAVIGAIPVGAATKEINASGSGFFMGDSGKPLWAEVTGTSACKINAMSGDYVRAD